MEKTWIDWGCQQQNYKVIILLITKTGCTSGGRGIWESYATSLLQSTTFNLHRMWPQAQGMPVCFICSATRLLLKTEHSGCIKKPTSGHLLRTQVSLLILTMALCFGCSRLISREQQAHWNVQLVGWKKPLDFWRKCSLIFCCRSQSGKLSSSCRQLESACWRKYWFSIEVMRERLVAFNCPRLQMLESTEFIYFLLCFSYHFFLLMSLFFYLYCTIICLPVPDFTRLNHSVFRVLIH